jgi:small-conductance mechanosensitive channel
MSQAFTTIISRYGVAILEFGGWLVGGLILQQLLTWVLRSAATRNHSRGLQALAASMKGIIAWLCALVGVWFAYANIEARSLAGKTETFTTAVKPALLVVTIALVTIFLARVIGRFITTFTSSENTKIPASSIYSNLFKVIIYILGIFIIVTTINPNISLTPLLGTLGIGGLAVGLALQSTLDNLFSGIQILASRQIEPGDFVRLETGEEGTVEDVTWRNTTIRRISSELVIVPNSILGKSLVVNFSRNAHAYHLQVPTTVAYGTDIKTLTRVVLEAAHETMEHSHYVHKEENPDMVLTANDASGISFVTVLPIIAYSTKAKVTNDFLKRLQTHLSEAAIEQPVGSFVKSV